MERYGYASLAIPEEYYNTPPKKSFNGSYRLEHQDISAIEGTGRQRYQDSNSQRYPQSIQDSFVQNDFQQRQKEPKATSSSRSRKKDSYAKKRAKFENKPKLPPIPEVSSVRSSSSLAGTLGSKLSFVRGNKKKQKLAQRAAVQELPFADFSELDANRNGESVAVTSFCSHPSTVHQVKSNGTSNGTIHHNNRNGINSQINTDSNTLKFDRVNSAGTDNTPNRGHLYENVPARDKSNTHLKSHQAYVQAPQFRSVTEADLIAESHRKRRRRRFCLCIIVTLVLLIVAFAVAGIAVYFAIRSFAERLSTTAEPGISTFQTPTDTYATYFLELKLLNGNYSADLSDKASMVYRELEELFCHVMTNTMRQAIYFVNSYSSCYIDHLRPGSIITTFALRFVKSVETNISDINNRTQVCSQIVETINVFFRNQKYSDLLQLTTIQP